MLDDETRVVAERLRLNVVFDEIAEALARVDTRAAALRLRRAEQSEFHGIRFSVARHVSAGGTARVPCCALDKVDIAATRLTQVGASWRAIPVIGTDKFRRGTRDGAHIRSRSSHHS